MDSKEVPLQVEEEYVNLDTEQNGEDSTVPQLVSGPGAGTSEEESGHADWEVMQPPLAASALTSRPASEEPDNMDRTAGQPGASTTDSAGVGADGGAIPSSELDSQWQMAGDSDHDSGYSDLGSDLDRSSSPDPTLDALRLTSQQHGQAASVAASALSKGPPSQASSTEGMPSSPEMGVEQQAVAVDPTVTPASSEEGSDNSHQEVDLLLSSAPDLAGPPMAAEPSEDLAAPPSAAAAAAAKLPGVDDLDPDDDGVDEEACWGEDSKPRSHGRGPAAFTQAALHSAWKWLQELVSSVRDGLPLPVRHAAAAAGRMDRSHLLGAGVAVLGTFLAAAAIRNKQLSHALRDKDRDMAQLVTKVFNLQHTLQSSRSIPIVRHTSSSCSFSFAGAGVTGV